MASRPWKPCAHPGCQELTQDTYCPKHRPPDRHRRSAEAAQWHRLYKLDIWTKILRPQQLAREPYCRACTQRGQRTGESWLLRVPATDVDHIVPHRGDMKLFTDPGNLQSLCHACHSRKTAAEMAGFAQEKQRETSPAHSCTGAHGSAGVGGAELLTSPRSKKF